MNPNSTVKWIAQYNKAIVGCLVSGAIEYFKVKSGGVTADEWENVLIAALIGGGLVWAVPNVKKVEDPPTTPVDPKVPPRI